MLLLDIPHEKIANIVAKLLDVPLGWINKYQGLKSYGLKVGGANY